MESLLEKDLALFPHLMESMHEFHHLTALFPVCHPGEALHETEALRFLMRHKEDKLTVPLILAADQVLKEGTRISAGFKTRRIIVENSYNNDFYIPVSPEDTPSAVAALCTQYSFLNEKNPDHISDILHFLLDFICIHPMTNGNGRLSILLTQFLMQKNGYDCALYLPLDGVLYSQNRRRMHQRIRQASGCYYGQKPMEYSTFVSFMMKVIEQAYSCLEITIQEFNLVL